MIGWLRGHLSEVALISLDNDLLDPASPERDVGEGLDVAEALAHGAPCCTVVLHTTNSSAARAMAEVLGEAGWPLVRVVPYSGVEWVGAEWARNVRQVFGDGEAGE